VKEPDRPIKPQEQAVSLKTKYEEKIESQIWEWTHRIAQLESQKTAMEQREPPESDKAESLTAYSERLETMRSIRDVAAKKLELLKAADESRWETIRKDLDEHWVRMKTAFDREAAPPQVRKAGK
jgi:hypothetical protein